MSGTPLRLVMTGDAGAGKTTVAAALGPPFQDALHRRYRDLIRDSAPDAVLVHLTADPGVLERRIGGRAGHFTPAPLLTSRLDALEPLDPGERAFVVDNRVPLGGAMGAVLRGPLAVDPTSPIREGGAA